MTDQPQAIVRAPEQQSNLAAAVVVKGDLSGLNESQLKTYYVELCNSLELNPLTRPFSLLTLNGKKMLYANRDCTDQLRAKHSVSIRIVERQRLDDMIVVIARATLPSGREDESVGAVPCGANVKGENLANAMMKAETKAKRRVALSICGLGFMDESEVEGAIAGEEQRQLPGHEANLSLSPHAADRAPASSPDAAEHPEYTEVMRLFELAKRIVFDPICSWDDMNHWRQQIGTKAAPAPLSKRLSELYKSDAVSEQQKKALGAIWNSVDRKLTALEGKLKPPPVEASFVDGEDGQEEPGANG